MTSPGEMQQVESGRYSSPGEVIDAALRLIDERDRKLDSLRKDVQEGLASGVAGPFDEEAEGRTLAKGRERLAKRQNFQ